MADLLEMFMVILFGASWPFNLAKLIRSRTTRGASLLFYIMIDLGYVAGSLSKIIKLRAGITTPWYVWFIYCLNFCLVFAAVVIYFRNRALERKSGAPETV